MDAPALIQLISTFMVMSCALCGYIEKFNIKNVCKRPWEQVYANTMDGKPLIGNKAKLLHDVMTGKELKVAVLLGPQTIMMRIDNVNKRHGEVCAESLRHLAHNGTHVHSDSPKRYYLVCSSGYVNIMQDSGKREEVRRAMLWYSRAGSEGGWPVFCHHPDGWPACGSLHNLWTAARTMALTGVMKDRGYVFPMHNVALDRVSGVVTGQNVRHIGQKFDDKRITFHPRPYVWYSAWSSNGRRDNKRWELDQHRPRGQNRDRVALDWYADTCWRVVYQHNSTGYPEFGTVHKLIEAVRGGHRIRVTVDDVTYEASNVRVSGEVVTAQLLESVVSMAGGGGGSSVTDRYLDIDSDTAHRWLLVHTTGTLRAYHHLVGTAVITQNAVNRESGKAMTWSADSRAWRVVLRTEDQGRLVQGDPAMLIQAVLHGASIRINLGMDGQSKNFLTEPDNMRIDKNEKVVYAQAMNHISDKKSVKVDEYELQNKAFHWYLMIDSRGNVRMSAWYVGLDERLYDKRAPAANVTWMANF